MKKALIILTIAFVIAAPSVVGAQGPQTGDFSAQVKTFFNKVFQRDYSKSQPAETDVSGKGMPANQERGIPAEEKGTGSAGSPEYNLPYCESADIDLHYKLASEYIRSGFPEYSAVKERHHQVGPCNRGNTAWTAFAVVNNEGDLVGQVVVNGDTEEVSFSKVKRDNIAPISTPVPDQVNPNEKFNLRSGEEMKLAGTPIIVKLLHLIETHEVGGDVYAKLQIEEDQGEASIAREISIKSGESEVVYKDYALTYLSGYEFIFEKADRGDTRPIPTPDRGDTAPINKICCKIYGYGDRMKEVKVHYEWTPKEKCAIPENFVGGNREVVDNEYCTQDVPVTPTGVECQNFPPPSFCPGGIEDIIVIGTNENGCATYGCKGEDKPETPAESETSEGRITIFDRIKNIFKGKSAPAKDLDLETETQVKCQNFPPPNFCPGGIEDIIVTGTNENGCATYGCKGEDEPGTPAESETGKSKTIFNRIKNVFRTKETPAGPGGFRPAEETRVSKEVRVKLEQKRVEVREKIREHYEEVKVIKDEAAERIREKKQEFGERIQEIRDEQKRTLADRIHNKIYDIREKTIENFDRTLDKINTVVTNISTRADKAENEGFNVENVRSAVSNAESKIAEARESVKAALGKEYSPEGTDLETLRGEFHSIRNELKNNLESVRNMVRNAHEATRSAAEELTQVLESE